MSDNSMQPVYPANAAQDATPISPSTPVETASSPPPPPRRNWGALARRHWLPLLLSLGLLTVTALFFYARSLSHDIAQEQNPVAATSQNLEPTIAPASPAAAPAPTDVLEQKQAAASHAAGSVAVVTPAEPSPNQLAGGMAVDTFGQAAQRRRAAQARADHQAAAAARRAALPPPDSADVTTQDAQTGAYRSARVALGRSSAGTGRADLRRRLRPDARPRKAPDGTPFEQNDDVLDMLDAASPAARASYEQMTGRRYFDRRAAVRAGGAVAASGTNGAAVYDAFGTVRAGSYRYAADNGQNTPLLPEIFYQAVVNGEQRIRTGSVVLLRLTEDAVISGQTFPKNLVFAGVATVETNHVAVSISRLGPTRVAAELYDYHYLPGLMIDPQKRQPVASDDNALTDARLIGAQEVGLAINRSASAANSLVGAGGQIAAAVVGRAGRSRQKLRDVLLPDGYPVLITTGASDAAAPAIN